MHILAFNWKDITHPHMGGAEIHLHEQAKRWINKGHSVTLYCPRYKGSAKKETIDGVQIYRCGGKFSTYLYAPFVYLFQLRKQCDVILDIENGIPFFTPLFSRKPVLLQMHHVHKNVFFRELPPFIAWFPYLLETILMPLVYRNKKIIAVSQSTADETEKLGFHTNNISIIHNGIRVKPFPALGKKAPQPTLIYLGRMMKYKQLDVLLQVFQTIQKRIPDIRLYLVGSGPELGSLKTLVQKEKIHHVTFYDFVTEQQKITLLQEAWIFVTPSSLEGWGITVIEANACGLPAVSFNVPGLREAIQHQKTGFVVPDQEAMQNALIELIKNPTLRAKLGKNAMQWSKKFTWDKAAEQTMRLFIEVTHATA